MERLLELLAEIDPDVDFESQEEIWDDEIIDSLDLTGLIADMEDAFDIEIGMDDIIVENFNTVEAMWNLVQRLQKH